MQHNIINILYLYLFLLNTWIRSSTTKEIQPYDTETKKPLIDELPKLIQQPAGYDVRLRCGIHGNHADFMEQSNVYWDFKRCGEAYNQHSCQKQQQNEPNTSNSTIWVKLPCESATLLITNPTESNSGLYRCSIQPYKPNDETTLQIQVVKTYQLDVINFTIAAPELLDELPANTTALVDSQVVLQCRVHSKVLPTIKWFRKQDTTMGFPLDDDENYSSKLVQFLENTYEHLESAGEKGLTEDTYLSKLILNGVSERDAGFYVCVGINYRGYKLREAYLNVIYPEEVGAAANAFGTKELLLLFLIPIGLALLPLTLWVCYLLFRSRPPPKRKHGEPKPNRHRKYSVVCENDVFI